MQFIIITGNEPTAASRVAAATAFATARAGLATLLASLGPTHTLGGLLDHSTGPLPQEVAPQLAVWLPDSLDIQATLWEERRKAAGSVTAGIGGDELPTVPGSDLFLVLHLLREQMRTYEVIILDAGEYGALLRALALPDGFRWGLRLLFGLDRDPGRSAQSQARALVPTALLPFELFGQVQQARVEVEELRDIAAHTGGATVGFVLAPNAPSLREAQLAVPALQLHGLGVATLVVGPLLPADTGDARLAPVAAEQGAIVAQAHELWSPRPILSLPFGSSTRNELESLGQALYSAASPEVVFNAAPPVTILPGPSVALRLPMLPKGALRLTVSGDELIVRVGPYRRHMLLPEGLRGVSAIKATRSGDEVVIARREG